MKRRFLIIHDYGSAGAGWFHYAYDRKSLEEIYASRHKCDEILEGDKADYHPLVKYFAELGTRMLTLDVDEPDVTFAEDVPSRDRQVTESVLHESVRKKSEHY